MGCFWSRRENEWGLNCKANIWKKCESRGMERFRKSWLNGVLEKERWQKWHLCMTERDREVSQDDSEPSCPT